MSNVSKSEIYENIVVEVSEPDKQDTCSICLNEFDELKTVTNCNHTFHENCIKKWTENGGNNCPLCRSKILTIVNFQSISISPIPSVPTRVHSPLTNVITSYTYPSIISCFCCTNSNCCDNNCFRLFIRRIDSELVFVVGYFLSFLILFITFIVLAIEYKK